MLIKSNIKKKTECTVFLEAVTIIAETIAIKEKNKKILNVLSLIICKVYLL